MNGGYSFSSKIKRSRFLSKGLLPETAPKTNTCMKTTTFYLVALHKPTNIDIFL